MGIDFILEFPGAIVRWIIGKLFMSNRNFKSYWEEDNYYNALAGFLLIVMFILYKNFIQT